MFSLNVKKLCEKNTFRPTLLKSPPLSHIILGFDQPTSSRATQKGTNVHHNSNSAEMWDKLSRVSGTYEDVRQVRPLYGAFRVIRHAQLFYTVTKVIKNFRVITWNVEENEMLHEIVRVVSRIPPNISCYIAENLLSLGQCTAHSKNYRTSISVNLAIQR